MAGMKADDGLTLRAYGHSGFFPCPDALNGNRIIITPPQGWPGSRGRQPLRRERAASSHSFRALLRVRGGLRRQRRTRPHLSPRATLRVWGGTILTGREGSCVCITPAHTHCKVAPNSPPPVRAGCLWGYEEPCRMFYRHTHVEGLC